MTEAGNIERAPGSEEPGALLSLALQRLFPGDGRRDLAEVHRLLARAAAQGHVEAIRTQAILIANGTGCVSDPAKAVALLQGIRGSDLYAQLQLTFSERMRSDDDSARLPSEGLSPDPEIRVVRGLLTPEECRYLIGMAEPHLEPSFVIDPASGARIPHPVRTSSGMSYGPLGEDLIIHRLNHRLARITGTKVGWGEPLHVLQYTPGQEYRPHVDALPGAANQRILTVLLYLNDGYGGGATRFDLAGVEFAGREGDALIFRNVDAEGRPDPRTRHAGLPIETGTKWLATRWIRFGPYDPWVP